MNNKFDRRYEKVGEYLRMLRLKTGFTQLEVAKKLGYSTPQFISNFERGIVLPPLKKMKKLMQLYGLSPKEFIDLVIDAEKVRIADSLIGKRRSR